MQSINLVAGAKTPKTISMLQNLHLARVKPLTITVKRSHTASRWRDIVQSERNRKNRQSLLLKETYYVFLKMF